MSLNIINSTVTHRQLILCTICTSEDDAALDKSPVEIASDTSAEELTIETAPSVVVDEPKATGQEKKAPINSSSITWESVEDDVEYDDEDDPEEHPDSHKYRLLTFRENSSGQSQRQSFTRVRSTVNNIESHFEICVDLEQVSLARWNYCRWYIKAPYRSLILM